MKVDHEEKAFRETFDTSIFANGSFLGRNRAKYGVMKLRREKRDFRFTAFKTFIF